MESRWNDQEAEDSLARYAAYGPDLALRIYSARLIGADPALVLHGGGNVSVKTTGRDLFGAPQDRIHVKGSGWDLAGIEPAGLPALDLAGLQRLRGLTELDDEEMVNQLRRHLLDARSPNPSVETLLHAFLPHRFVDHSHADAILALSDQERGEEFVAEAFGDRVAALPFVMPGFPLAQEVARLHEERPEVEGIVLHRHGLFTFGETARESYERHIALVDAAERFLAEAGPPRVAVPADWGAARHEAARRRAAEVAPRLRRALAAHLPRPPILRWLDDEELSGLVAAPGARELFLTPPLTPDHTLRTKNLPCWAEADAIDAAVAAYAREYHAYFERGCARCGPRRELDPAPRVVLVPEAGVFAAGPTAAAAAAAADLAAHTLRTKAAASALGPFRGLDELELFGMEYWSLEQAKLGRGTPPPLAGRVAVVTGGGGAIGEGIGAVLAGAGAVVALLDLDAGRAEAAAARIRAEHGPHAAFGLAADVTDESSLDAALAEVLRRSGGLDVLVPNAGAARVAELVEEDPAAFRRLVEVNLTGVFLTLRAGGRILREQGLGGSVVLVSSKNVPAPGAAFGAYSASKAGAHQLARIAALELAADGVRVNAVCPDAVFRHGDNPSGLWAEVGPDRARSKGLAPEELEEHYRRRNLLRTTVSAEDVGRAVLWLAAEAPCTTGCAIPVDGGIPQAFPR
ncbi:MAG: SDR family oxidoreductase [Planctomycetota bacterium]|nr:MAG: SDR family oxidoreductase [Planctomycetota bacterium]